MRDIKNILIIKTSALGDIIRSLPALVSVAKMFPSARITFMIGEQYAEILEACPYVREVIPYRKRKNLEDLPGFFRFVKKIRARRFDAVINLQNTNRFDLIGKLSGSGIRTKVIELDSPVNGVEGVYKVLETAGIFPSDRPFEFWFTDKDREYVKEFFSRGELAPDARLIGICPGGGWLSKQWPIERYAELSAKLAQHFGGEIVVFGSREEVSRGEKIAGLAGRRVFNTAGESTIRQAACLIEKCAMFVSNDSGLMHLAAHLGVPTVGIFGPTSPERHGPCREGNRTAYISAECSPCHKPACPLEKNKYRCMTEIPLETVFAAVVEAVEAVKARGGV